MRYSYFPKFLSYWPMQAVSSWNQKRVKYDMLLYIFMCFLFDSAISNGFENWSFLFIPSTRLILPLHSPPQVLLNQRGHLRKWVFLWLPFTGSCSKCHETCFESCFQCLLDRFAHWELNWYHHRAKLGSAKLWSNANNLQPVAIKVNFPLWLVMTWGCLLLDCV